MAQWVLGSSGFCACLRAGSRWHSNPKPRFGQRAAPLPHTQPPTGGVMMLLLIHCATTISTGSMRYREASSQPMGGAPSTNGYSHSVPRVVMEVGPARLGSQ